MGIKINDIQNHALRARVRDAYDEHVAKKPAPVASPVSATEPERPAEHALAGQAAGEEGCRPRTVVRVTAFRVSLCDADNNAGGCKALIDCLRHAKIIPDDSPEHIELVTRQVRVGSREEEGTEIVIIEEES